MKILDRYIVISVLKTAVVTILLFALILAAVELFSMMDQLMSNPVPFSELMTLIALSLPQYMLMAASIALLFAVTYFLSMLTANNELIALLNSGISSMRIKAPLFILAVVLTLLGAVFQEEVVISANARHDSLESELFGTVSTKDARNLVLEDPDGYLVYTRRFSEEANEIASPVLVRHQDGKLQLRVRSDRARFDEEKGVWVFLDAWVYHVDGEEVTASREKEWHASDFDIPPRLFRNQNTSIETMDRETAAEYLAQLASTDHAAWQENATDYYRRIFSPLAVFVLVFISLCMNYRFKKNILLFSVIQSLAIAVIYYVADMVFSIMGHQGAVSPAQAVFLPFAATVALSVLISLVESKL